MAQSRARCQARTKNVVFSRYALNAHLLDKNCLKLPTKQDEQIIDKSLITRFANAKQPIRNESKKSLPKQQDKLIQPNVVTVRFPGNYPVSFPLQTLEPKVILDEDPLPTYIPRAVEVARRRLKYLKLNVNQLLKESGINTWMLVPVFILKEFLTEKEKRNVFDMNIPYFPLEWFDNTEFDIYSPDGWLKLGVIDGIKHPLPALAFLPADVPPFDVLCDHNNEPESNDFGVDYTFNSMIKLFHRMNSIHGENYVLNKRRDQLFCWQRVAVNRYIPEKDSWVVITIAHNKSFMIPRIYLMFVAENPQNFTDRLKYAVRARQNAENHLRFNLVRNSILFNEEHILPTKLWDRILKFTYSAKNMKGTNSSKTEVLKNQINSIYQTINAEREFVKDLSLLPDVMNFFTLPTTETTIIIPSIRTKNERMRNFRKRCAHHKVTSLYCDQQICLALQELQKECQFVEENLLFSRMQLKNPTFNDFIDSQKHTNKERINYLNNIWIPNVSNKTTWSLRLLGKGWYDINVNSWQIYEKMKLYRLMQLFKYRMQDALRILIDRSTEFYLNLLCAPCKGFLNIDNKFEWNDNLMESPFEPMCRPVFYVVLKMNQDGAFYDTDPLAFSTGLVKLFNDVIYHTHFIRRIEEFVMPHLVFPKDNYLSSVGLLDKLIVARRQVLMLTYHQLAIVLNAYAMKFEQFNSFYILNLNDYIAQIDTNNVPTGTIKHDIDTNLRIKTELNDNLPDYIQIGTVQVNVRNLKITLINKREELANRLIDYIASRISNEVLSINLQYQRLFKPLKQEITTIEQLNDLKLETETYYERIASITSTMQLKLPEYEILENYNCSLETSQFDTKWTALSWPKRLYDQIEHFFQKYDGVKNRLWTEHLITSNLYLEQVEKLREQVNRYSLIADVEKTISYATEVDRTWKLANECLDQGNILNNRNVLFDSTKINLNVIKTVLKNLKPYKRLWCGACDYLKSTDEWTSTPYLQIDIDAMERDWLKFIKLFKELIKSFETVTEVREVAEYYRLKARRFEIVIKVLKALRNNDWSVVHFIELKQESKQDFRFNPTTNMNYLISQGIMDYVDLIVTISERATKEREEAERHLEANERVKQQTAEAVKKRRDNRRGRRLLLNNELVKLKKNSEENTMKL